MSHTDEKEREDTDGAHRSLLDWGVEKTAIRGLLSSVASHLIYADGRAFR